MLRCGRKSYCLEELTSYLDLKAGDYNPLQEPKRTLCDLLKYGYIEGIIGRCDACELIYTVVNSDIFVE